MQPVDDLAFIHKWVPAESGSSTPVTLLLLHGTGGDENSLLPVGNELWPGAALLGVQGKVLENGVPHHFDGSRRLALKISSPGRKNWRSLSMRPPRDTTSAEDV